jgi:hypothetical protein
MPMIRVSAEQLGDASWAVEISGPYGGGQWVSAGLDEMLERLRAAIIAAECPSAVAPASAAPARQEPNEIERQAEQARRANYFRKR